MTPVHRRGTHREQAYRALQRAQKTRRTPTPQDGEDKTVAVLAPAGSAIIFDYRSLWLTAATPVENPHCSCKARPSSFSHTGRFVRILSLSL